MQIDKSLEARLEHVKCHLNIEEVNGIEIGVGLHKTGALRTYAWGEIRVTRKVNEMI